MFVIHRHDIILVWRIVFCVVLCFCVLFVIILCLLCPMLPLPFGNSLTFIYSYKLRNRISNVVFYSRILVYCKMQNNVEFIGWHCRSFWSDEKQATGICFRKCVFMWKYGNFIELALHCTPLPHYYFIISLVPCLFLFTKSWVDIHSYVRTIHYSSAILIITIMVENSSYKTRILTE